MELSSEAYTSLDPTSSSIPRPKRPPRDPSVPTLLLLVLCLLQPRVPSSVRVVSRELRR
jgi:hypothetical protein